MSEQELKVRQQPSQQGRVFANDREMDYAGNTNSTELIDKSYIVKIEKYDTKKIRLLNRSAIPSLVSGLNTYQSIYPESEVLALFQLNKGISKTDEHIEVMQESQLSSNLRTFVFQENNARQDEGIFIEKYKSVLSRLNGKEPYVLFELEGNKRIRQKITLAIASGVKKFIFRGGKWNNIGLWVQIVAFIQANDGEVFISLPKRMQNHISYIKKAFQFGADYAFHEILRGWKIAEEILHLNENFEYVIMGLSTAVSGYPEDLRNNIAPSSHYRFSRVRAINVANSFANTIQRIPVE